MALITLTPARVKQCNTPDPDVTWSNILRPSAGVIESPTDQVKRGQASVLTIAATSYYYQYQTMVEFDTSAYSGISTNLILSMLAAADAPDTESFHYNIVVAGVNLYPETPHIYWPEEITGDFDYYQQETVPENTWMIHNVPGERVLGSVVRFCIASWNCVTETAPGYSSDNIPWDSGTQFVVATTGYTLEFEEPDPVTAGNVLFNAFSL